ncbi:MAG TPA: hypothetical protein VFD39_04905 [Trueperaceae bacterium]|nr:hypothetical protein [Trueperaceae bacterium]
MLIVALDPGKNVGVAYVSAAGELLANRIVDVDSVAELDVPPHAHIVVGGGTGGRKLAMTLRAAGLDPEVVDERSTSIEARELYYRHNPPRGLTRLLPTGMRSPPVPLDDYAAYAIALRWLALRAETATSNDAGRDER